MKKNLSYETFYTNLRGIHYLHAKFQINILKVKDCRNWFRFLSHSLSLLHNLALFLPICIYPSLSSNSKPYSIKHFSSSMKMLGFVIYVIHYIIRTTTLHTAWGGINYAPGCNIQRISSLPTDTQNLS